jgi:hypothetical protein
MKLNKIFAAFMLMTAVAFTACEPPVPPTPPGPGPDGQDTTVVTPPTPEGEAPDTTGWNIPAGALTVAQAREICAGLTTEDQTSTEEYYVMGWVKKVDEVSAQYGNATFYMVDVKGADTNEDFQAYRVKGLNGNKISNEGAVAVGDFVVLYGKVKQFYEKAETATGTYIWKSTNALLADGGNSGDTGNTGNSGTSTDSEITVPADALVFDAATDQGDARIYDDAEKTQGAKFTVTKDGVTITVANGLIGTASSKTTYRIYKGSTLTVSSTAGNIKSITFTCTANDTAKQGPGCFTVDGGKYVYSGANGQWTGDAASVTFTASSNQVRATQIAVVVE